MQPTHARFEHLSNGQAENYKVPERFALTNGDGHMMNGDAKEQERVNGTNSPSVSIFDKVPAVIERNFMVTDTIFESPSMSGIGIPGPDGDYLDVGPNGLANVSTDVLDELPPECRAAFELAKQTERDWMNRWGPESQDGSRGRLKIGLMGYPV